jgi:hypothetical protein
VIGVILLAISILFLDFSVSLWVFGVGVIFLLIAFLPLILGVILLAIGFRDRTLKFVSASAREATPSTFDCCFVSVVCPSG